MRLLLTQVRAPAAVTPGSVEGSRARDNPAFELDPAYEPDPAFQLADDLQEPSTDSSGRVRKRSIERQTSLFLCCRHLAPGPLLSPCPAACSLLLLLSGLQAVIKLSASACHTLERTDTDLCV